jgi:hypothetical protein
MIFMGLIVELAEAGVRLDALDGEILRSIEAGIVEGGVGDRRGEEWWFR